MASSIDATKPITGTPTTASVRSNFSAAKSEIEALQGAVSGLGTSAQFDVGIAEHDIAQIDNDSVAENDYARFTADGLVGRSAAEVLSDIGALAASGGTLTNVKESIYYAEVTANVTIDWANGDVQYLYVNPAVASIQITMPADPGAVSKAGILFIKNNTGKAHTWNTSPAIRFVDQADADTVPTPAAVGYYTRYTCQWNDNNGGTGSWWIAVAGRDTA